MIKHWTPSELKTLRRLREGFLSGTAGNANYWRSSEELALYDSTFAERIGWKWDGALRELELRAWKPKTRRILDWGCGTGIAARKVLSWWPGQFTALAVHDRAPEAMRYAFDRARTEHPKVSVRTGESTDSDTLLVISHVINELPDRDLARLLDLARGAGEVIWVEAGAHAESRKLIAVREKLLSGANPLEAVAPCTHQARCGLLTEKNEQHWCHHFAKAPSDIFQDARWHDFSQEFNIDLRSLPYSFLVMQRPNSGAPPAPEGFSRVIGRPREFKGHDKVLSCQQSGVEEFMLQKRDAPGLMKDLRKGPAAPVYRWKLEAGKILGAEPLAKPEPPPAEEE